MAALFEVRIEDRFAGVASAAGVETAKAASGFSKSTPTTIYVVCKSLKKQLEMA
jgi:hypothetical protein